MQKEKMANKATILKFFIKLQNTKIWSILKFLRFLGWMSQVQNELRSGALEPWPKTIVSIQFGLCYESGSWFGPSPLDPNLVQNVSLNFT